jgi:hypothetical protein
MVNDCAADTITAVQQIRPRLRTWWEAERPPWGRSRRRRWPQRWGHCRGGRGLRRGGCGGRGGPRRHQRPVAAVRLGGYRGAGEQDFEAF